jgi:hypothetical protein
VPHPTRSRHISLVRLSILLLSALAILASLYLVILYYIGNGFLALFLLFGG